jgi:N-acetylglucosaminyl-diphospho-decaprenol L-rhamnosyltransferase
VDLTIVIVNYNGKQDLLRCLRSLDAVRTELACETMVVDNGSTDGSIEVAETAHPGVQFIRAGKNLGFAAGCNVGLREAKGRHALLLNPDTEVLPGALRNLVSALDSHPNWGGVGPLMVDSRDQPYYAARRFPTPFDLFCECTRLAYLFPHSRFLARYFYGEQNPRTLNAVDQVEGSALVISEAARRTVGLLDERFFIFFEEVDWCKRVKEAGFEIHIVPLAVVRHHRSTTMSRFYSAARVANAQSAMKYFQKHHGEPGLASLRRWMRAALCIRLAITATLAFIRRSERLRLKFAGAKAERAEYQRGLGA